VKVRKRMLIAHEDGPTRLALMRSFESRDWAVQGVRTDEGVVEMLDADKDFSTLLLSWEMPKHAAVRALTSLGQLAAEDRPVILAFGHKWPLVELQRALQFGADGVLVEPLKPEVVEAELAAWEATGETRSRKSLLDQHAEVLLQATDDVWAWDDDENWRGEMQGLSSSVRDSLRRSRGLETDGEPMDAAYLHSLVENAHQALGLADSRRLRALLSEEGWNGSLDEVTRRRLAPLLGRNNPEDVRVDMERLRALFGPSLEGLKGIDVDRLRGLLSKPEAQDAMDPDTIDRLKGLKQREMGWVVDYVWLMDMRSRYGRAAGGDEDVDTDRLKGLRTGGEASEQALSPEETMRLQLTMAMMFRVRNDEDRGRLVDRLRNSHGQDGRTALMLKGILMGMGEDRTLRLLREKLGISPDGATSADVSRLLSKNDLDPAIFGVAEVADDPVTVGLLNELGMRLRRAKRWDDASHHYERALQIMPRESSLLFNFARLKLDLGFVEEAETLVQRMDSETLALPAVRTLLVAISRARGEGSIED